MNTSTQADYRPPPDCRKPGRRTFRIAFLVSLLANGLVAWLTLAVQPLGSWNWLLLGDTGTVGALGYCFWCQQYRRAGGVGLGYVTVFVCSLWQLFST